MDMACVTCHAIGGVGGKVGPDYTSIGGSAPVDYLVESMLFPNRKIKEGYHSVLIETRRPRIDRCGGSGETNKSSSRRVEPGDRCA
jgi:putative heme-binding domain-containing protein